MVLFGLVYNPNETCSLNLVDHGRGYLGILLSCMIAELAIIWLSMRGSILYTEPRDSMQYVLYVRLGKRPEPPRFRVLFPGASSPRSSGTARWPPGCAVHPDESIGCALSLSAVRLAGDVPNSLLFLAWNLLPFCLSFPPRYVFQG